MGKGEMQDLLLKLTARSDLLIAVMVMVIVFLMILPVPTIIVDILIALNMSLAVILVMVAVYLPSPLSFSAFPAVLLLTTLFRLALSITTTRLILLQADAGKIVESFGSFVVGGNMVVGLVVFLIITIVQFVVITKGSERVAEVGARFSLDAMPGKQMSIDGDLRAGGIENDEASARRRELEKESQLYGAMDGAMKFVKGDAIAGIIIIIVNIIGGISIGVLNLGLSMGEAGKIYSILTIGDGLVAQIPALLISITAGIIVTRVSVDDKTDVGKDIVNQVMAQPKALLIGSVVLFLFALIPGFPTTVFLTLSILLGGIAYALMSSSNIGEDGFEIGSASDSSPISGNRNAKTTDKSPQATGKSNVGSDFTSSSPLVIEIEESVKQILKPRDLNRELGEVRGALYHDLGVPFPSIDLVFRADIPDSSYKIMLDEVPVAIGYVRQGMLLVRESAETLNTMGISFDVGEQFLPDQQSQWVDESLAVELNSLNLAYMTISQILVYHLSFVLKHHAGEFLGIQECRRVIEEVEKKFPDLVKEVQRLVPLHKIADILRRLVSEEVSIKNMRLIMESLVEWGQSEKDPITLTEYVRSSLKRFISHKFSCGSNVIPAYIVDPNVEDLVRKGVRQTATGSYLALEPDQVERLMDSFRVAVGELSVGASNRPVVVVSMDVRRYVRRLIEQEFYELPVLSYQELTDEVTVQPLNRISI